MHWFIFFSSPYFCMGIEQYKKILSSYKRELQRDFGVTSLGLFGSYTRGEEKRGSDLDVLVDFNKTPSIFELVGLENRLSGLLGVKVDLIYKRGLDARFKKTILPQTVVV